MNAKSTWGQRASVEKEKRRRKKLGLTSNSPYKNFQEKYKNDWRSFVLDCFIWNENEPTDYQLDTIEQLQNDKRLAVRAPHGAGKTALAAWIILAFALTRDGQDWKIVTTAGAWQQLTKFLWPEIHKWCKRLNWQKIGRSLFSQFELLILNMRLNSGEAFSVASENSELIEGAHADCMLYIYDESKSISDETFNASEGAFSGAGEDTDLEAFALAISTPGEPSGRFYNIHRHAVGLEDWSTKHIKLEDAIRAGRISKDWAEQRKKLWGEKSALYQNRVLGEFCASDEDSVIPLAWVEKAIENWYRWEADGKPGRMVTIGADIGGGGENSDQTVLAECYEGNKVDTLRKYPRGDPDTATMQTAGMIKAVLDANPDIEVLGDDGKLKKTIPGCKAIIDVIGIGQGCYNRLREQGLKNALPFNAAKKAEVLIGSRKVILKTEDDEFSFVNNRSAAWIYMAELLDPKNKNDVGLPDDNELIAELASPKKRYMSNARIQVESKDDIKKRIKRSTDSADAVIQGLCGELMSRVVIGVGFG